MQTHINYSDISSGERKQLSSEAFHRTPILRWIRIVAVFAAVFLSGISSYSIANRIFPGVEPHLARLCVGVVTAPLLYVIFWTLFGRSRLRMEIVNLKNA